jgi:diaminohydroxyphosphoribosylaminopyrimidine deaminase/5-amino-6-(5-phosphoribosylamino)uracil reductase
VNGNGVRQLREAGIAVDGPLLEAEAKQLIAPFIARTKHSRAYITMKWAQSEDRKIAGPGGKRIQISNPTSSHQVQLLRSRCDAIVVGINTVLNDDPILLPKNVPMLRPYRRIVLDRNLRLPMDSQLVKSRDKSPLIICSDQPASHLTKLGIEEWPSDAWLRHPELTHVLMEPGPTLANAMFSQADRLWVIRSPKIVGDNTAPSAAKIPDHFVQTGEINLDGDVLHEYLNTQSAVFFAAVPSADFCSIGVPPME